MTNAEADESSPLFHLTYINNHGMLLVVWYSYKKEFLMDRKECHEFLKRLPVEVSFSEMKRLIRKMFSYLPSRQMYELLGEGFIAYPPIFIPGTVHVLRYRDGRLSQSHMMCVNQCQEESPWSQHVLAVMKFARQNWRDQMFLKDWKDVIVFNVMDSILGMPTTTKVVWGAMLTAWRDIVKSHARPQSRMINQTLSYITVDPVMGDEMGAWGHKIQMYCCAKCGGGLLTDRCSGCGLEFESGEVLVGRETPLPERVVGVLCAHGECFPISPRIAREKERENWRNGKRDSF